MGKKKQRSLIFLETAFDRITRDGKTVTELADELGLSHSHAYKLLEEVEAEHGLERKALLRFPHKQHEYPVIVATERLKPVDPEEFRARCDFFSDALRELQESSQKLKEELEALPEEDVEYDEEFLKEVDEVVAEVKDEIGGLK